MKHRCAILLPVLLVVAACTKKTAGNHEQLLGLDYYPTATGKYVVYEVDSTLYTDLPKDTLHFRYRIKERIAGTFTDDEGRQALRLERFIKSYDPAQSYDNRPWTIKEVWMVNPSKQGVEVVESNIRYTKLMFPIQQNSSWNGNAHNTLGEWNYTIDYIEKPEVFNGVALDKVLLVTQKDLKTLISWQWYTEKYAKGVGLVAREITDIYSNSIDPGKPVEQRIEKGIIYKQRLVEYGYD